MSSARNLVAVLSLALLAACAREVPAEGEAGSPPGESGTPSDIQGRVFERAVVFVGAVGDSTLIVPWLFTARTKPGGVDRTVRAWLKRGDVWEPFFEESWETE